MSPEEIIRSAGGVPISGGRFATCTRHDEHILVIVEHTLSDRPAFFLTDISDNPPRQWITHTYMTTIFHIREWMYE